MINLNKAVAYPFVIKQSGTRIKFKRIWVYLEVGRLLHVIAITASILAYLTFKGAYHAYLIDNQWFFILYGLLFLHFASLPFYAELDARSRYQNYKMVCDLFYKYGYRDRFIKALKHSKCQREAAYRAGKSLSCRNEVRSYFYNCGYRWYHIFPDFILKRPDYLFTKHFWLTTFFTRTYVPKYFKH